MITASPQDARPIEARYEADQTMRVRFSWPVSAATGAQSTAVVRTAIEPGHRLGTHRDNVEEVILILEGTAEVSLGDEVAHLSAGELAVVPAMMPHGMRNVGTGMLRFVGFFPSATVASIFDQPLLPGNHRIVGTPTWMAALQQE